MLNLWLYSGCLNIGLHCRHSKCCIGVSNIATMWLMAWHENRMRCSCRSSRNHSASYLPPCNTCMQSPSHVNTWHYALVIAFYFQFDGSFHENNELRWIFVKGANAYLKQANSRHRKKPPVTIFASKPTSITLHPYWAIFICAAMLVFHSGAEDSFSSRLHTVDWPT